MRIIYLDSAATAPPSPAAIAAATAAMENFGNPSSLHQMGINAEKLLSNARQVFAKAINARPAEIHFTSGGTEANGLAILGAAKAHKGSRIITTHAEHPSISECMKSLAQAGFEIFYATLDSGGRVDAESLKAGLAEPTSLVSIHHVNNETGVEQDIAALGAVIKASSPQTAFHVDAVQSLCKIPVDMAAMHVDALSMSGHKLGGIKGAGALYVRQGVHIKPMLTGGGQESGLRGGTENVPGITAMAAAIAENMSKTQHDYGHIESLRECFLHGIKGLGGISINGTHTIPHILNMSIDSVRPEVLVNALSARGVCISAGAACSSNKRQKQDESAVLRAYGLSAEAAASAVRVSFSAANALDEVKAAADIFVECVDKLRSHARSLGGIRR